MAKSVCVCVCVIQPLALVWAARRLEGAWFRPPVGGSRKKRVFRAQGESLVTAELTIISVPDQIYSETPSKVEEKAAENHSRNGRLDLGCGARRLQVT